jgi:hypothetical protein
MGRDLLDSERRALTERLIALQLEHRDLDAAIGHLESVPLHDELQVRRMKKRKLALKDQIVWLERQLEPDEPA